MNTYHAQDHEHHLKDHEHHVENEYLLNYSFIKFNVFMAGHLLIILGHPTA